MKRRRFSSLKLLLAVAVLIFAGALLWPVFMSSREPGQRTPKSICQNNLKQINLGLLQYSQDYDERFPHLATGGSVYGWADALQPYIKSVQIYQCPKEGSAPNASPRSTGYTDYWFNRNLAGISQSEITSPELTLWLGEGSDGSENTNARYSQTQLPSKWLHNMASPAYRHQNGMNLSFADGHVKWYDAAELTPTGPPNAMFSVPLLPIAKHHTKAHP